MFPPFPLALYCSHSPPIAHFFLDRLCPHFCKDQKLVPAAAESTLKPQAVKTPRAVFPVSHGTDDMRQQRCSPHIRETGEIVRADSTEVS